MKTTTRILFLFAAVITTTTLDLPSSFKICKRKDPKLQECVKEATKSAIIIMADGLKNFKILPIEPLIINSLTIDVPPTPTAAITQRYKNVKIHGLTKDLQLSDYKLDLDSLIYNFKIFHPKINYDADYESEGKILLLTINGHGTCMITLNNTTTAIETTLETFQKEKQTYLKIKKVSMKMFPEHITVYFENIVQGNPVLSERVNEVLNENALVLFDEFKAPFQESLEYIFGKIANNIFVRIPMDKLFPLT